MGKSYTEIKDSTLKWCKKLKKEGIYSEKDYEDCENSFRDLSLGEIPQDMKEGKSRIENSFSLYGRTSEHLEDKLSGNKSQVIIETNNGLKIAANKDNTVFLANPDTISNEEESYWRLIPKKENQYLIVSNYGKYLSVDENKRVSADRTEITPQVLWNIDRNNGHLSIESFHHQGYKLSFVNKDIVLLGGISDTQKWKLKPVYSADGSLIKLFDDAELLTMKKKLSRNIKKSLQEKYKSLIEYLFIVQLIKEIRETLNVLLKNADQKVKRINEHYNKVKNNFIKIKNNCQNYKTITTDECEIVNVPIFFFFRTTYKKEKRCKKIKTCDKAGSLKTYHKNILKRYFEDIDNFEEKVAFTSSEIIDYKNAIKKKIMDQLAELEEHKNKLELYFEEQQETFLKNDKLMKDMLDKLMRDILDSESSINNNNLKLKSLADEHRDILKKNSEIDIYYNEVKRKSDLTDVNKNIVSGHNSTLYYEYYGCLTIMILTIIICGFLIRSFMV